MRDRNEVKITFTLPKDSYASAKRIAEREGVTVSHILRRAIKTEQFLDTEQSAGKKILIDDGKAIQRLVRM